MERHEMTKLDFDVEVYHETIMGLIAHNCPEKFIKCQAIYQAMIEQNNFKDFTEYCDAVLNMIDVKTTCDALVEFQNKFLGSKA